MISVSDALTLIDPYRPDLGAESVPLLDASGRQLSDDIIATFTHPASATSVMDGYAFRSADLGKPMIVVGESRAGRPYIGGVGEGEAVRIFTGAHLPQGTDHIEIQEYAVRDGDSLYFSKTSKGRNYTRPQGSSFTKGDLLFEAGLRVTPAVISILAIANLPSVMVKQKPTIALLRCGDELRPVGSEVRDDQIIDSNGPFLISLLNGWGFDVIDLGLVKDDPTTIKDIISHCAADIILPVGGASVGDYDYMKSAFFEVGFKPIFDTVAIKPGKPVWLSYRNEQVVLGFPGNPHSVFACSHIFLSHLLGRSLRWETRLLADDIDTNGIRERYIPAKLIAEGVTPIRSRGGLVMSMAKADVLIRVPSIADEMIAGCRVDCVLLR